MMSFRYFYLMLFMVISYFSNTSYQEISKEVYVPLWKKRACEMVSLRNNKSHYICDSNNQVQCLSGWQGDLCDVPVCLKGCDPMSGYCQQPNECLCKIGFYGKRCNKCIPLPGCQHGYCSHSFECKCYEGWNGIFCSKPICKDSCHPTRGYCEVPGECRCKLGWTGPNCQNCQVIPGCQHGKCTKPLECICVEGYTGFLCQIPICAKNCDRQHGYCKRSGECRCKIGWMGENCSQCHPYPGCTNGFCRNPWECICEKGWGGILCNESLNYCEQHPGTCQNNGKCISVEKADGNFRCLCPIPFYGKFCEMTTIGNKINNDTSTFVKVVSVQNKTESPQVISINFTKIL